MVGDNGTALLGTVQDANDEAGQKLNTIAKGLQGQTVDATDMHDQAMEILSNAGVTKRQMVLLTGKRRSSPRRLLYRSNL